MGGNDKCTHIFLGNLKGRYLLGDLGVDGKLILK
jgi:hypothetical protein